jgi:hypothetical protein
LRGLGVGRDADPERWGIAAEWGERIRALGERLAREAGESDAVAFFRFRQENAP